MATDIKKIIANLLKFYDFSDKTIISVGAGGGQIIEYAGSAKHVIAVDNNKAALDVLEKRLHNSMLANKFTLVHSDFNSVYIKGDIVMFEFSLHEMKNTVAAIHHAFTLAPNVLIGDHWIESEWAYIADEDEKVTESWKALEKFSFKKIQTYTTIQFFYDYDDLLQKVSVQGENSIDRINQYKGKKDIAIPMKYCFALI